MKHRISRRAFLRGCTLLAASAAVGSLTSCGGTNAKDSGLPQIIVGSDTYPPYIYLNNDGVPAGIDVEIATEAFRRMGYAARFETIDWEQKTNLVESGAIDCIWGCFSMQGREEMYRWAGPYMVSRQVAAVDADSSIRTLGDLAGKTIHTTATVKEVREKETPALDDEFAKKVGFDSYDELVEQLKTEITNTKAEQLPRLKESRCVTELSHRIKDEIPEAYLDFTRENILRDFFNSLQEQGTTFDQFLSSRGITSEQFREDLEQQSREEAEECLALDALFKHLGMEITEEDIEKEFSVTSNPEATRKAWEDAGRMSIIREAIKRQRATKWLVDNAVVTIDDDVDEKAED